jgi:hypothetical protein
MPARLRCPAPGCTRWINDDSPSPDFCSHPCAVRWIHSHYDPDDGPGDGRRGWVHGADYGPGMQHRNRGSHVLGYAFPWLDARLEAV